MYTILTLGLAIATGGHPAPATEPWWGTGQTIPPVTGHQPIVKIDGKDYPPTTTPIQWGPGTKTVLVRLKVPAASGTQHRVEMLGAGLFFNPQKFTLDAQTPERSVAVESLSSCTTALVVKAFDAAGANPVQTSVPVTITIPYGGS